MNRFWQGRITDVEIASPHQPRNRSDFGVGPRCAKVWASAGSIPYPSVRLMSCVWPKPRPFYTPR